MSTPRDEPGSRDPLEPVLADVEAELKQRLREACEAEASGVSSDATAEIRRLEDTLLAAAVAAEQTITLRRHIDRRRAAASEVEEAEQSPSGREETQPRLPNEHSEPKFRVREFRDSVGQLWRAWPVTPGQARPGRTAHRYL